MENVEFRLLDRISDLTDNVMETILMHLPTRDAVRTSILSRKWRNAVSKLPQLVLDETFWKKFAVEEVSAKTTFIKVLYRLLLGHDAPIYKFTLSYPGLGICTEIDILISFLSKRYIQDFSLKMWDADCYVLPLSFFSFQTLRYLELKGCSIIDSASMGFKRLTSIKLIEVTITAETLALLISGSPLLAILEIETYSQHHDIDVCIDAPNLRTLSIAGYNVSINFKRVSILASVSIMMAGGAFNTVGAQINSVEFFDSLLALETLQLSYHFVKSIGLDIPERLSTSLLHLKDLKLYRFSFNEMPELLFTLCLLRSSSNLKYIEIKFEDCPGSTSEETASYMEGKELSDMCLSKLREVSLLDVTGTKSELEFIKLLLAKSSSLKKIRIQPDKDVADKGLGIIKELINFRRRSPEAQIII